MANHKKGRTERYSAQLRASQYKPDLDDDIFSYQSANNPSLECPIVLGSQHYYGPGSAASSSSAANTLISMHNCSQNSSTGALPEPSNISAGPTPPQSTTSAHTLSSAPTSVPTNSSPSTSSSTPFSIFPASVLRKTQHSKSKSHSQALSGTGPRVPGASGMAHHVKSGSVASTRSKLIARVSRSSLQLNLRTSQPSLHPVLLPSPVQSPGGTWDGPNLTPSPMFPIGGGGGMGMMDAAFMREQQMQYSQGVGTIGAGGVPRYSKEMRRNSVMSYSLNRQDDGRLQLEQERQYHRKRILWTWTRSKVVLLLANTLLLGYSIAWTLVMTMSWKGAAWTKPFLDSGIMMIANRKLLLLMMAAAPFGIFVALIGFVGLLSQNRKVLSIYTILLWPLFGLITAVGYICYRRLHVSLYQKLKFSWINEYSRDDRLVIQNALSCCGFRSLGDYPSYDLHCFPRAPLPACENRFIQYQQDLLSTASSAAFILVPVQLVVMVTALLCSNHVDHLYRSAYPITPKLYTQ
ncbi:hypothetical protein BG006_008514 [Podila minutissima]|uniref:Tetraspanin Tsp2 n=1 Tax=Podila minutissima TaxID=64525 RepID=A0A9P5SGD3_9FUNG|nr:hypothetical protein BG006_008514 [Podila minutissima]